MNLKDIVDKLASIDKLEKMSSQLDQKIPGQQTNLDPKADVTAMTQALAAVRDTTMPQQQPAAPQSAQPAQTMTTEPPQQDAPPPERRELQQKQRPGEPVGEELVDEQKVNRETALQQARERVKKDPTAIWKIDPRIRNEVMADMTPRERNFANVQRNLAQAYKDNDQENIKRWTAEFDRRKEQFQTTPPTATDAAAQTPTSPSATQDTAAATDTNTPAAAPPAEAPKPKEDKPPAPKANLGSGDWYRGKEGDYTIQKGDTLSSISKRTGVPLSQLMRDNNIQNPNKIVAGAKLKTGQDTAQAGAASNRQEFGLGTGASDAAGTNATAPAADTGFKFTPEQEKFLGNANRQDPVILSKMPGPKPPLSHFTNPEDRARAIEINQGAKNWAGLKNMFGGGEAGSDIFSDVPAETDTIGDIIAKAELDKKNADTNKPVAPSVSNPNVTDRTTSTTTDNTGKTTTTTNATLTGISQRQIMQHPAYVAFMNDPKNKKILDQSPQMARDMASMQARTAIANDPTSVPPSDDQLRSDASSTDPVVAKAARDRIAQQQKDALAKVPRNLVPTPVAQPDTTVSKPVPTPAPQRYVPGSAPEAPDESMQPSSKRAIKETILSLESVVEELNEWKFSDRIHQDVDYSWKDAAIDTGLTGLGALATTMTGGAAAPVAAAATGSRIARLGNAIRKGYTATKTAPSNVAANTKAIATNPELAKQYAAKTAKASSVTVPSSAAITHGLDKADQALDAKIAAKEIQEKRKRT